jgi:hypothetical protein
MNLILVKQCEGFHESAGPSRIDGERLETQEREEKHDHVGRDQAGNFFGVV